MSIKFGLSQRLWVYYNKEMIRIFGPQKEGENYIMKSFIICIPTRYFYSHHIKEDEMAGTCSTHGEDKCVQRFCLKTSIKHTKWETWA